MPIENFSVELACLFCGSALTKIETTTPQSGSLLHCPHCGASNDYDSVIEVAKEKAISIAKEKILKDLPNIFKRK